MRKRARSSEEKPLESLVQSPDLLKSLARKPSPEKPHQTWEAEGLEGGCPWRLDEFVGEGVRFSQICDAVRMVLFQEAREKQLQYSPKLHSVCLRFFRALEALTRSRSKVPVAVDPFPALVRTGMVLTERHHYPVGFLRLAMQRMPQDDIQSLAYLTLLLSYHDVDGKLVFVHEIGEQLGFAGAEAHYFERLVVYFAKRLSEPLHSLAAHQDAANLLKPHLLYGRAANVSPHEPKQLSARCNHNGSPPPSAKRRKIPQEFTLINICKHQT